MVLAALLVSLRETLGPGKIPLRLGAQPTVGKVNLWSSGLSLHPCTSTSRMSGMPPFNSPEEDDCQEMIPMPRADPDAIWPTDDSEQALSEPCLLETPVAPALGGFILGERHLPAEF